MITSINDYLTALADGNRAFANLHGIKLTLGDDGLPLMHSTSRFLELEATWHNTPCRIYCPFEDSAIHDAQHLCAALKRIETPYLAAYRLLPNELNLGNRMSDIVIEVLPEGGRPLNRILAEGIGAKQARRMAAKWIATANALAKIPFSHRALSTSRIIVRADGNMTLCGLHHGRIERSTDDHRAIIEIAYEILRSAIPDAHYPTVNELLTISDRQALCKQLREIAGEAKVVTEREPSNDFHLITRQLLDGVDFSDREWVGIVSEDRILFSKGKRYGYLDMMNNVVIDAQFIRAEPFHEGRAAVETDKGVGLIDKQGRWIIAPEFEDVNWSPDYNIATVNSEKGWALYDSLGNRRSRYYDYLGECADHRLTACDNNRWGYIDTHGCEVIAMRYDDAFEYKNGRARVVLDGRPLEIDLDGLEII